MGGVTVARFLWTVWLLGAIGWGWAFYRLALCSPWAGGIAGGAFCAGMVAVAWVFSQSVGWP